MKWTWSEETEQRALFEWASFNRVHMPELALMFHVGNGGWRHPTVGAKLRALGVKPGVPDIWLPCPRGGYSGLVIEMKAPSGRGRVSPEQAAWLEALRLEGWGVAVMTTWVDAANAITLYLRNEWGEFRCASTKSLNG